MNFINIIGTLFDNSIEHIIALAEQIKDLRLNKNQQDINEDVYNKIDKINQDINEGIIGKEKYTHKLITESSYHNLDHYEKDTLYLVVNSFNEDTSVFGDKFPLILGGETNKPSVFGGKFPFILDGDNLNFSEFGDTFPFILSDE